MIMPPVFDLLDVGPVTALVGTSPARIYSAGVNPNEPPTYPYLTWMIVAGVPASTFELPGFDNYRVQVDCWSPDVKVVRQLAEAARNAMENGGDNTLLTVNEDGRDPDTKAYRFSMDFSIWVSR